MEKTDEQIPYAKLGPENPILHHGSLYLFESDLEDCGYAMGQMRFRVMEDCYFILVRYYLRVDGVRVRMFDTRIYHEFGTNYLVREFKHLESDFEMLRAQGFGCGSEWMLSPMQADEVAPCLKERARSNSKVSF